ncbi:holin [Gordonia phage Commandaria]|uniref:Holin n=1 Tax=Gordonia phage Commandaria TaxID=3038364 RepID=A0AAF0GGA8_9CAUD|nr:holin [Gordonia phage Commandaria]WGH20833.1 holin [Gordonia phage Commandaria]
MTLSNIPPVPAGELIEVLRNQIAQQPWYARFSNTVTSGVGLVLLIVWVAVSNAIEIPGTIETGIGSIISALTLLGVLRTPNGVTPRGVEKVEEAARVAAERF